MRGTLVQGAKTKYKSRDFHFTYRKDRTLLCDISSLRGVKTIDKMSHNRACWEGQSVIDNHNLQRWGKTQQWVARVIVSKWLAGVPKTPQKKKLAITSGKISWQCYARGRNKWEWDVSIFSCSLILFLQSGWVPEWWTEHNSAGIFNQSQVWVLNSTRVLVFF